MKSLLGLFLLGHGLMHVSYLTPKPDDPRYPFDFTKSWFAAIAGEASKPIGGFLAVAAAGSFVLAGLGLLGIPGLENSWKLFATAGAVTSTLLLALFWHPWLVLGFVINAALIYGIYQLNWNWR